MFDLKHPCKTCPFRKGNGKRFQLCEERIDEIVNADAFQCHNTVDYDAVDDDGYPINGQGDNPQQCAGLMAILHREGRPNQIMRVAERISDFDPSTVDPRHEAYESLADAIEEHTFKEEAV